MLGEGTAEAWAKKHVQRSMAEICMWVRGTVMGIVRTFLYAEAGKSGCCGMVGLHEEGCVGCRYPSKE